MKILKWLLIIAVAVLLFPFLLRTVGWVMAIIIGIVAISLISAIGRRFADSYDDVDFNHENRRRATHDLKTEFAEDEGFTEEELRALRERNRHK